MTIWYGFDINTSTTPRPWGTREEQYVKDHIQTTVMDCVEQTIDVTGHKHWSLYDSDKTKVVSTEDNDGTIRVFDNWINNDGGNPVNPNPGGISFDAGSGGVILGYGTGISTYNSAQVPISNGISTSGNISMFGAYINYANYLGATKGLTFNSSDYAIFTERVGINTTSPSTYLDVNGSSNFSGLIQTNGNYINNDGATSEGLTFSGSNYATLTCTPYTSSSLGDSRVSLYLSDNTAMGAGVGGGLVFRGLYTSSGSNTYFSGIKGVKTNATDGDYSGQLHFQTRLNGDNLATRMVIDENGDVGIGKSTLEAWTGTLTSLQIGGNNAVVGRTNEAAGSRLYLTNNMHEDNGDWKRISTDECSMVIFGDGNTKFYNDISDVAGTVFSPTETMRIGSDGTISTYGNYINNDGATSEGLTFDSSNNAIFTERVGVGTNSPSTGAKLHLYSGAGGGATNTSEDDFIVESSGNSYISINTPADKQGGILFSDGSRNRGSVIYSHLEDKLKCASGGSTRLALFSDGTIATYGNYINNDGTASEGLNFNSSNQAHFTERVGIGTSSPQQALHIAKSSPVIRIEDTDSNIYSEVNQNTSIGSLTISADVGGVGATPNIDFRLGTTTKLKLNSNSTIQTNGNFINSDGTVGGSGETYGLGFDNSNNVLIGYGSTIKSDGSNIILDDNCIVTGSIDLYSTISSADIESNKIRIRYTKTPSSSSDTGNLGEICYDTNYMYVCTATNTWKRISLSTF